MTIRKKLLHHKYLNRLASPNLNNTIRPIRIILVLKKLVRKDKKVQAIDAWQKRWTQKICTDTAIFDFSKAFSYVPSPIAASGNN